MTGTALLTAIALAQATAAVPAGPAGPPAPATSATSAPTAADASPTWRGLVVVLAPRVEDDVTRNALARISGELAAAPFKTITTTIDPDSDVMAQVETAGSDRSATAAFAIVRDREPGSNRVTIWVSNRISRTTTMQRMNVEGGDVDRAAARLAVETVELVRASLAGLWPTPAPPAGARSVEKQAAPRPARLALEVAIGQLRDFGDPRALWMPKIAVTYLVGAGFGVRLSASGLGSGAAVSATQGSARLDRAMLTLGLVRAFRSEQTVQPLVGIAGGIHYLSARGMAASSSQPAHDLGAVSALATASAGVAVALSARVAVLVEADLLMLWPTVAVRVADTEVATIDRFSLFTQAGLLATF
jgi:hypothetical protein